VLKSFKMSAISKILLASNSPRRKELLSLTGWIFSRSPANIDETPLPAESPRDYVCRVAKDKAKASRIGKDELILAADTIVVSDNQILGKPVNPSDAQRMLEQLRGRTHQVLTAIVLIDLSTGQIEEELCQTDVPMRNYSNQEIEMYIATGDPMDKAGGYAIQHAGFHPVENFQGCFASVMGLPLCHLKRMALLFDHSVSESLIPDCQRTNNYICPIFQKVAEGAEIG
jgi:septum formation protein